MPFELKIGQRGIQWISKPFLVISGFNWDVGAWESGAFDFWVYLSLEALIRVYYSNKTFTFKNLKLFKFPVNSNNSKHNKDATKSIKNHLNFQFNIRQIIWSSLHCFTLFSNIIPTSTCFNTFESCVRARKFATYSTVLWD